jgi:hypothetical protein
MRFALALLMLLYAGCGCDVPRSVGAPFGHTGTATITGSATIASSIDDDLDIQFLLSDGGVRIGVLPENLFDEQPTTCGGRIDFEIQQVEAGTFGVALLLRNADTEVYDQLAAETVTVADGESVTADLTFP